MLFSWGGGGVHFNKGQCGHGTNLDVDSPHPIKMLKTKPVVDVACGGYHTIAICRTGEVYAWGSGNYGELGTGEVV